MNKKTQKKKVKNVKQQKKIKKKRFLDDNPILKITLNSLIIVVIIWGAIIYSDNKGYFNPNESNNHTKKKWDSFYKFTEDNNVDVLLVGNSHLYSGINPKNLSSTLGVNAFILASPGTNIADSYFALKEALTRTKPNLVIIETFGINDFNPYTLTEGPLSDHFKSFYARKDWVTKLISTPFLFKSDNYLYAWSNTIRNHDFIFKDTAQLSKNISLMNEDKSENKKLYLGRFVRFQTGIENEVLAKYDSLGAPVDGKKYKYSKYAKIYIQKIKNLCEEKKIDLIFLTLPMYHKHIKDYSYWKNKLTTLIDNDKWLDMQSPYDTTSFTTICFENTYNSNQHMTYNGSLIATYKLADYIRQHAKDNLVNRKTDLDWQRIFYGEEGYFENNPVLDNDKNNKLLCSNFSTNNVTLREVSILNQEKSKNKILIAKVTLNPSNIVKDIKQCRLRLALKFILNNQQNIANVDLQYDIFHRTPDYFIFKSVIKPIEVKEVKAGILICH